MLLRGKSRKRKGMGKGFFSRVSLLRACLSYDLNTIVFVNNNNNNSRTHVFFSRPKIPTRLLMCTFVFA